MPHVGTAPDQVPAAETPVCTHVSVMLEDRKNVASHANVAVAPCPRATGLYTAAIPFVGVVIVAQIAIPHVGSEPPQVPLAVVPVCVHVRGLNDERE